MLRLNRIGLPRRRRECPRMSCARLEHNENNYPPALRQSFAVYNMMWGSSGGLEHLDQRFFIQKGVDAPRLPMISHIHPWANTIVLGGTRWCFRARPLPDVHGGALGEASGDVSFHLCEQGRPQGASFSAGDLSL